jgi:uridine kinase
LQSSVASLAQRVEALGRRVAVGISGPDCAGKSTLAGELAGMLRPPVLVVSGDDFTRPTHERYAEQDQGLSYYRDSFDYGDLFERLLPAVRSGFVGDVVLRVTDWDRDGWRQKALTLAPEMVLIVEGCFLFAAEGAGAEAFDLSVWLDLPLDRVVERALARPRDLERMGGPAGVRERYEARYLPGQRLHLIRDAPSTQADIVLPAMAY